MKRTLKYNLEIKNYTRYDLHTHDNNVIIDFPSYKKWQINIVNLAQINIYTAFNTRMQFSMRFQYRLETDES